MLNSRVVVAVVLVVSWLVATATAGFLLVPTAATSGVLVTILAAFASVLVGTAWTMTIRTASHVVVTTRRRRTAVPTAPARAGARVAILSPSADDFDETALRRSMQQTYPGVDTVVLDDSSDPAVTARVDRFAAETGIRVVRRAERTGYKAGNLNHFLHTDDTYDFYAVRDSDEVLPVDFVELALRRMDAGGHELGVVQGAHRTHRGRSPFADRFGTLLETHVDVSQGARAEVGLTIFMGRGALLRATCARAVGGFPEVVAEDLAFSVRARAAGFAIAWAPEIVSTEDYAVDFRAFRTQHGKFAQGSVEALRRVVPGAVRSSMRVSEKVDLLLETVAAPLSAALGLTTVIAAAVTAATSTAPLMPGWMGLTLLVGGLVPLLPAVVRRTRAEGLVAGVLLLVAAFALYGSTLAVTLTNSVRAAFTGKAVFRITPKHRSTSGVVATLLPDVLATVWVAAIGFAVVGSVAPAAAFAGSTAAAVMMVVLDAWTGGSGTTSGAAATGGAGATRSRRQAGSASASSASRAIASSRASR